MNKTVIVLLLLTTYLTHTTWAMRMVGGSISDCTPANAPFKFGGASISPNDHFIIGDTYKVTANGTLSETITGGSALMTVQWYFAGGWHNLPSFTFEGCTDSTWQCPTKPGFVTTTKEIEIPLASHTGKYRGRFSGTDQNGDEIVCLDWQYELFH
eukprot:TRINITY_DN9830_c0_g1_i1.p1 TRINITY_DN9830_c0_g1~~TRINITY_DN9830_c0_g1_i1.p1  ORF type:complete len:168 (-),score=30.64 TRINITY_DN9830_c0_g1_i1:28-492(-)